MGGWVRRHPATFTIATVTIVMTVLRLTTAPEGGNWDVFDSEEETVFGANQWWRLITSSVLTSSWVKLALLVPLILVVVGESERLLGVRRAVVAWAAGTTASLMIGLAASSAINDYLAYVPLAAPAVDAVSPATGIVSVALAASYRTGALWRRRIRITTTLFALTLMLYSGDAPDLFALVAVPVGLVLGFALGGRGSRFKPIRSSHHEVRVLLASLVVVSVGGPVIAAIFNGGGGLLSNFGYLSSDSVSIVEAVSCAWGAKTAAACPGVVDVLTPKYPWVGVVALLPVLVGLIAAWGVLKGRRAGLWLAIALELILFAIMVNVSTLLDAGATQALQQLPSAQSGDAVVLWQAVISAIVSTAAPLLIAASLVLLRRHVYVAGPRRALRSFVRIGGASLAASATLAVAGQISVAGQFRPVVDVSSVLSALPERLLPPSLLVSRALLYVPTTPGADLFWYLPSVVCWAGLVIASARLILSRPVRHDSDATRARMLLEQGGGDTVSFMSTWPQTSFWFTRDGRAVVAYRVQGFIAITLGGPFGPGSNDPEAVNGFVRYCGDHGLTAAFYSVDDDHRELYEHLGWRSIQVAEEAVLDPTAWTTSGKKWQDIRTAVNRAGKVGLRAEWTRWRGLSLLEQSQIVALSEAWVSEKDLPEMSFTLGGVDQLRDDAVRVLVALDDHDRVRAVTSWLPRYERGRVIGYTLDFMRREPDAVNGIMEFLIASAAEQFKAEGLTFLSLSGAPLARTTEPDALASGPLDRLLDDIGARLEPAYGFRSLLAFKRKFQPQFVPLWLIYPDTTDLPGIAVALARCYLPELTLRSAAKYLRRMRA
ncbi:membrane protein [Cnuibacter physcomitrellae]|uniref:Uncharacterized protein n=2 Tax=Cnuibacter physcomitrellae TaxID=1619308 RepID=A0A1X9M094_9MICO|nr:DUF2156 domain-containing protein [Cnuibacter physcomitrellae]ARJ07740.1 hypothetical protein B5808_20290 [Cnuibacter physcomitrellae]GGI42974.1 membrane protein [Cnuibacter physcomitrellae]